LSAVVLIEMEAARVEQARSNIVANLAGALKRGKLSDQGHADALANFNATDQLNTLADTDLVIEAIFEDMNAKRELFAKLDNICKSNAILATNTSYLDVNEIAAATSRTGPHHALA